MRGFLKKTTDTPQKRRDGARFFLHTLAFSVIILAVLIEFSPYLGNGNLDLEQIKFVESSTERVLPKDVLGKLLSGDGKPVMLMLYASWCGYCSKLMPSVLQLVDEHGLDGVKPIFISLDTQPRVFAKYMVKTGYYKKFNPIMFKEMIRNTLPAALASRGSQFTGAIPYIGFYDSDGKMVAETFGLVDKQELLALAELAQKSMQHH